jgi:alkylhydroperoxidase family enzyme
LQQEAQAEGVKQAEGAKEFRAAELVESVLHDLETSQLNQKDKALLRFVDKVNHHSPEITAADMQPLYAAGWTDEAIYYAITVCALFNFYNRWIDASGVPPLSDEAHRQGGHRSANAGYVRK